MPGKAQYRVRRDMHHVHCMYTCVVCALRATVKPLCACCGCPGTFGGLVPARYQNRHLTAFYFLLIFVYIHKCPGLKWLESFASKDGRCKAKEGSWRKHVCRIAWALEQLIDEVDYSWRLDPTSHGLPPWDKCVTCVIDTLPVYVPAPQSWWLSTFLFQPKYKACVLNPHLVRPSAPTPHHCRACACVRDPPVPTLPVAWQLVSHAMIC
jgi:hypothetical protein